MHVTPQTQKGPKYEKYIPKKPVVFVLFDNSIQTIHTKYQYQEFS